MKTTITIIALVLAQSLSAKKTDNNSGTFVFKTSRDLCIITVCSDNILKIDYRPDSKKTPNTPVIDISKSWEKGNYIISNNKATLNIQTKKFEVIVKKEPFKLEVKTIEGKQLLEQWHKPEGGSIEFKHNETDNLYGLSGYNRDVNSGIPPITRNDGGKIHAQPQGGCGAPFIWSTSGYGILLDTDGGSILNTGGVLSFSHCSKTNYEYYIIIGEPKTIIKSAGLITGLPPMFPKWTSGFGQLEWGINESEFKTHINEYRKRDIPIDWFMIDFDWMAWGESDYGEFRWGSKFPSGSTNQLKTWSDSIGIKIVGITKPRIIAKDISGKFTMQGSYAEKNGFWYPGEDFFNDYFSGQASKDLQFAIPECREWWWSHLQKGAFDKGIVGFLNDECDDSNVGGLYSLGNLTNIYMQQSIYEGQRSNSNKRVWSVNRTAYTGSQKYAYGIWSGDNYPTFEDLRTQPAKMLVANNCLVPTWGFCATSFWDTSPIIPEFYIRSLQLAMFSPLFFLHGAYNQQKQPWFFGESVVKAARDIIQFRYKMIPYIYSYERIKHESMLGISRALMIDYPNDSNVVDMSETFMFGDYILASPVLTQGMKTKKVYLPEGEWINYNNGAIYQGKTFCEIKTDDSCFTDIPMFIKKGAIIPTQDVVSNVEKATAYIYVDVFPNQKESFFHFYDDDGLTYEYEKGNYLKKVFRQQDKGSCVEFDIRTQNATYKPSYSSFIVKVHSQSTKSVELNKENLKEFQSYESLLTANEEGFFNAEDRYGKLTYIKVNVNSPNSELVLFPN